MFTKYNIHIITILHVIIHVRRDAEASLRFFHFSLCIAHLPYYLINHNF